MAYTFITLQKRKIIIYGVHVYNLAEKEDELASGNKGKLDLRPAQSGVLSHSSVVYNVNPVSHAFVHALK